LVNTVTVNGTDPEGTVRQFFDTETVTPQERASIALQKTASPPGGLGPVSGQPPTDISFVINLTNTGDVNLGPITLTDQLPLCLEYMSDNRSGTLQGKNVSWNIASLSVGQSAFIELVARIGVDAEPGILQNQVEATAKPPLGKNATSVVTCDVNIGIQPAIDAASAGDTILIPSGTYIEDVNADKALTLQGVDTGGGIPVIRATSTSSKAITLSASGCTLEGLEITGGKYGIYIKNTGNHRIRNCNVHTDNIGSGTSSGIYIYRSSNNVVSDNTIHNNDRGLYLSSSSTKGNVIRDNDIHGNNRYGIYVTTSAADNKIYLNNVRNNDDNAHTSSRNLNSWNSPTPQNYVYNGKTYTNYTGNFWSDYNGTDVNGDGIGDSPYHIITEEYPENVDNYPFCSGAETSSNLEVEKKADIGFALPGQDVHYTVWVNNTGNVELSGVTAYDNLTAHTENIGTLLPGENHSFSTTYQIKPTDLGTTVFNEVVANGTDPENVLHQASDLEAVDTIMRPSIEVNKVSNRTSASVGDTVEYTIWVNNTGNVDLIDVEAYDNLTHQTETMGLLKRQEHRNFSVVYQVEEDDLCHPLINNVTVNGTDPNSETLTNFSVAVVEVLTNSNLEVKNIADVLSASPGKTIHYSIWVNNTGDKLLSNVKAYDDLTGHVEDIGLMTPGTGHNFSTEYLIGEDDLHKRIINNVSANGTDPCGDIIQNSSSETVIVVHDVDEAIALALSYILSCQNSDGGFGASPGSSSDSVYTGQAALALVQTGDIGRAVKGGKTPLDYLTGHPPSDTGTNYAASLGRYIMGVVAAGGNPYDVGGVNYVKMLKDEAKKGLQASYFSDALVLLGMASVGQGSSQEAQDYVSWVKAAQSGGSWAHDVDSTGLMINALVKVGEPVDSSVIQDAIGFLRAAQNPYDGGFPPNYGGGDYSEPDSRSNSNSGECAIMAINSMGGSMADWSPNGNTPITHLLTCQQPSGLIWWQPNTPGMASYYIACTAYGVIALDGGCLPTAEISQMPEMNPKIEVKKTADVKSASLGESIHYSIWVNNTGNVYLNDTKAYDNLTGEIEQIGLLVPGQSFSFEVFYQVNASDLGKVIINEVIANGTDSFGVLHENSSTEKVAVNLSTITGFVWEDSDKDGIQDPGETGVAGVVVEIKSANPGKVMDATMSSGDYDGHYGFYGLKSGDYIVEFEAPIGYAFTLENQGNDDEKDSDACQKNGCTDAIHLDEAVIETSWDAGFYPVPALNVTKTADETEYKRGDEITYNISICNEGREPATNVVVRDIFDRQVKFVSASPMPSSDGLWHFSIIPPGTCQKIVLVVEVHKQIIEAKSDSEISGVGFVNVASDYSTTLEPYVLKNTVRVTSDQIPEVSDSESVTILGDPGTELTTREHGSGIYNRDERVTLKTENKSISMYKDLSAEHMDTTLNLYGNRSIVYSSRWNDQSRAKNRVTGTSIEESYRRLKLIDKESSIDMDKNGSTMKFDSEFNGTGHISLLKKDKTSQSRTFESSEDYEGSFKVMGRLDEYGSGVESDKFASGSGFVNVDKRIGNIQGSREYGSGSYQSDEMIRTYTNYIYKDLNVTHQPSSFKVIDSQPGTVRQTSGWDEAMWSKSDGKSLISEEYTDTDRLNKETVAEGLNQMDTDAHFSGNARFRVILLDDVTDTSENNTSENCTSDNCTLDNNTSANYSRMHPKTMMEFDDQYMGDYSIQRSVLLEGVPKFGRPHLTVTKSGELFYVSDKTLAKYEIVVKNDGNQSLSPIRITDTLPLGAIFVNASARPIGNTDQSVSWAMTHLGVGDNLILNLWLDVTNSMINDGELVNLVDVYGGYDDDWVSARNFDSRQIDWLSCNLNRTLSVTKKCEQDQNEPNIVTYSLIIENLEEGNKTVQVVDDLPEGMVLRTASISPSSYQGSTIIWDLVDLGSKEEVRITYEVEVSEDGLFVNEAQVYTRSEDGVIEMPVYASATLEIDEFGDWNSSDWKPPAWGFKYPSNLYNQTCEDICELMPE